jgi:hypothetical protein
MPLVQIDLDRSLADLRSQISEKVHQAFVASLGIPANDKWCIFRLHDDGDLIFDPTNGAGDRESMLCIQVTMVQRYDAAAKHKLFEDIAARLEELGIRHQDVLICGTENHPEDWYDGRVHGG